MVLGRARKQSTWPGSFFCCLVIKGRRGFFYLKKKKLYWFYLASKRAELSPALASASCQDVSGDPSTSTKASQTHSKGSEGGWRSPSLF